MESYLEISQKLNVKLVESLVAAEQKFQANEQYSRRNYLKISVIPESVSDNALEDKIQGVLTGIDVEVDTDNFEQYHCLKGKGNKGRVILKLTRKETEKIISNRKSPEKYRP